MLDLVTWNMWGSNRNMSCSNSWYNSFQCHQSFEWNIWLWCRSRYAGRTWGVFKSSPKRYKNYCYIINSERWECVMLFQCFLKIIIDNSEIIWKSGYTSLYETSWTVRSSCKSHFTFALEVVIDSMHNEELWKELGVKGRFYPGVIGLKLAFCRRKMKRLLNVVILKRLEIDLT